MEQKEIQQNIILTFKTERKKRKMPNIIDYIQWRGDLSLTQTEFNQIDNLILSRLSYFPFDHIIKNNETITISEAYNRFKELDINKERILQQDDLDLFPAMANSNRFGSLFIKKYVNKRDAKEEKQFSAITIIMPDKTAYVAYRGTDNTLVGWKEDFNMSFMDSVPAQKDAVQYLDEVAKEITRKIKSRWSFKRWQPSSICSRI